MKRNILSILAIAGVLALLIVALGSQPTIAQGNTLETSITFDGTQISVDGAGAVANGSTLVISSAGSYRMSGTLTDGQVIVDTDDTQPVTLILDSVSLSSATSAPLYVKEAESVTLSLAEGTANTLADAATYVYASADEDEPNAALFSDDDLTIDGSGSLTVTANFNDGITSKDTLTINGGQITVTAVDDGIRGKDSLTINGGEITVTSGGDGLKSDNEEDAALGTITIGGGTFNIRAGGDAVQAETTLTIHDGVFNLEAGGGSGNVIAEDDSAKGLKAGTALIVESGVFAVNAADDTLHANESIVINGGSFSLASGDDAVHADTSIEINDGEISIATSYEGIESLNIALNGGTIHLVASDDGINGSDGSGGGEMPFGQGQRGGMGMTGGTAVLTINGGYIYVDAEGDGVDVNGSVTMTGGMLIVNGPTNSGNGALDYDGGFSLSGGTIIAVGSAGMMQAPDNSSSQLSLAMGFSSAVQAGTPISITDSSGQTILSFIPAKQVQSIVYSSAALQQGETYTISLGGSVDGQAVDGVYDGAISGGTSDGTLTLTDITTMQGGGMGGFRGGRP
ncbi:MAG: carbohydrate-binding domain-containing protein [Anaerolineae bacterium]|nr:carbohydrate-binding domain-containing protein [Anaerolineae bacterium]